MALQRDQFRIVTRKGDVYDLYASERDKILTELAIEREKLTIQDFINGMDIDKAGFDVNQEIKLIHENNEEYVNVE